MIVPILSADDPRVALYKGVRERDLVRDEGRFIVEGAVTLARMVEASRFEVESLFLAEGRAEALGGVLAKLDPGVPAYTAPQGVMDAITGFHIHRGVLALARRGREPSTDALLLSLGGGRATVLALVGLSNHDNVGACFRNAAALGADAALLDQESCDPLYRKSIRVSAGTALALPFARSGDGMGIIAALKARGFELWAMTPAGGETLQKMAPPERLAIVLGAEGPGLSPTLMNECRRVSILMAGGIDSLNVATAGAIALAHVAASRATNPA